MNNFFAKRMGQAVPPQAQTQAPPPPIPQAYAQPVYPGVQAQPQFQQVPPPQVQPLIQTPQQLVDAAKSGAWQGTREMHEHSTTCPRCREASYMAPPGARGLRPAATCVLCGYTEGGYTPGDVGNWS